MHALRAVPNEPNKPSERASVSISSAFVRRPRLTRLEAIVLNELMNAAPKPITARRLATVAYWGNKHYTSDVNTIKTCIYSLRAKLGEAARKPSQIVTVKIPNRDGDLELAYKYLDKDEGEVS